MKINDIKFKSEYLLNEQLYKEASLYSRKTFLIFAIIETIIATPIALLLKNWLLGGVMIIAVTYALLLFVIQQQKVNKAIAPVKERWSGNNLSNIYVELFDDTVLYKSTTGEHIIEKEFNYKDIKRVWKSKNLIIFYVKNKNEKYLVSVKRETVSEKEFLSFIKEKRKRML